MTRSLLAALIVTTALVGCSRLNPGTWLNSGADSPRPEGVAAAEPTEETRVLVDRVSAVAVDRTAGGAIIRATGITPTQGFYQPGLVALPVQDGTLTLEFRVAAPEGQPPVGPEHMREIIAAAAVSADTMRQVSRIVVRGASNALAR